MGHASVSNPTVAHTERLAVPWLWWPPALSLTAGLAAQVGMGASGPVTWMAYLVLVPATAGGLWWLGRIQVSVVGGELRVDDARLPVRLIADVIPLDAAARHELLGASADPLAFVIQRPWIRGAVQVVLDDPADPTPYWLISTRHPDRLAATVQRSR